MSHLGEAGGGWLKPLRHVLAPDSSQRITNLVERDIVLHALDKQRHEATRPLPHHISEFRDQQKSMAWTQSGFGRLVIGQKGQHGAWAIYTHAQHDGFAQAMLENHGDSCDWKHNAWGLPAG